MNTPRRSLASRVGRALLGVAVVFGLCAEGGRPLAAQEGVPLRVIVNVANPLTAMSPDRLYALFLKRRTSWAEGGSAQPVDLPPDAAARAAFSAVALGRPVRAVVAYWQQQIFSGRGVPPLELDSESAVVEYVRTHPGAIGYVSAGTDVRGVKVVEMTR